MGFFSKVGMFFSGIIANKKVQSVVTEGTKIISSTPPGAVLKLAMDLGAFDWLAKLIAKSVGKVSGVDDVVTNKILLFATKSIVETQGEIDKGKLETAEQKRGYAQERFKFYMLSDVDLKNYPSVISIAPVLIQFVYETGKLKSFSKPENRDQIVKIMFNIGVKYSTNKDFDPIKELFEQLDLIGG